MSKRQKLLLAAATVLLASLVYGGDVRISAMAVESESLWDWIISLFG